MAKKKKPTQALSNNKQVAACIVPDFLFLGPVSSTSNSQFLSTKGITHILSIGKRPVGHIDTIHYERLGLTDEEDSDIRPVVEKACNIIDAVSSSHGKVLIHCSAAISRSPTIVAAYLMMRCGMTLRAALEKLVEARDAIAPNPGFCRQLANIEKELFSGKTTFDPEEIVSTTKLANIL